MNKRAFTLIEIMATIIVAGVMFAIALPHYIRTIDRSREHDAAVQLQGIKSMQISYRAATDAYYPNNGTTWAYVDDLNSNLKLNLVENQTQYRCQSSAATFTCEAHHPSFAESSTKGWVLAISESGGVVCPGNDCPRCTNSGCPFPTWP